MIRDCGLRNLSAVALFGMASGLLGCTGGVTTAEWCCRGTSASAEARPRAEPHNEPLLLAPAPSARVPRSLTSARKSPDDRITNTGWRMGVLYVRGTAIDELNEELSKEGVPSLSPWLTAWGYQFEILRGRYGSTNTLFQIVPLAVGLDQSVVIPAVNVVAVVRFANGVELGGGPHYTPRMEYSVEGPMFVRGLGFAASVGYAFDVGGEGKLRIPVSLVAVFAGDSTTYSVTMGWTLPRD